MATAGTLLLACGSPSHRTEMGLTLLAEKLALKHLIFTFTPEAVQIGSNSGRQAAKCTKFKQEKKSLEKPGRQRLHQDIAEEETMDKFDGLDADDDLDKRLGDNDVFPPLLLKTGVWPDTTRLSKIAKTLNAFLKDKQSFDTTLQQLRDIQTQPASVNPYTLFASFTLLAFSSSLILFNGTWLDGTIAACLGGIMGVLIILALDLPVYARVFDISACALVSFLGRVLSRYCCYNATVIPAIVILLPGYNMTLSVMELTEKQVVSGTIRLAYAIFYTFMLGYGLHIGSSLYNAIDPSSELAGHCPTDSGVPTWTYVPMFPLLSISIGLSFGANWRQWFSQTICAGLGFTTTFFLQPLMQEAAVLNTLATFVVGLYCHLTLRYFGEQPLAPLCVGITLLLPGSLGVKGAYAFLNQKDTDQASFAFNMLNVALGLSVGLFASAMVVYPWGKPKSLSISM
ncbi:hypothetical protein DM01DRAFT_1407209 [Hesseltinella vesiculosa]|uniref:DUF1212-domain-containing protein n=1 Tax=Hesseltinella vesiculosa TaxID=101127 RepID=A0A1X2GJQ0_9FUNG|nr:hypothetical protein DM01DRAFT_1407209 [Hesseltinella vesiculosa]